MIKSEKGSDCPDVSRTPVSAEHEARFSDAGQKQKTKNLKYDEKSHNNEKKQA